MAKNSESTGSTSGKGLTGGKSWLAILRIYIGAYFIHSSLDKFTASYINEFSKVLGRWAHDSAFEWYRDFLGHYVVPHAKFFAYVTAIGEFAVGVMLIVGLLSGLAAILGVFLYANYYLGEGNGSIISNWVTIMICLLVILFTGAGRIFGFDKYLSKKILFKYIV